MNTMDILQRVDEVKATKDGDPGRRRTWWRKLRRLFGHRCNDLLPSNRVLQHLRLDESRDLGLLSVPLTKIVGSSGRAQEFDLSFRPRRGVSERWRRIADLSAADLPPVSLAKVGDAYFVEDGNHRVSVARAQGKETIEARVIEIDPSPLRPEPSCQRLGFRI